jgi:3D (Asp-Asp-Asp) domain-containing protein
MRRSLLERQLSTRRTRCRSAVLAVTSAALLLTAACTRRQTSPPSAPVAVRTFEATAYCQDGVTASGVKVREGIVAADPAVLPLGSLIRVDGLDRPYNRVYHVLDTGRLVRGREIDLFMRSCDEAIKFGRRSANVSIVRPVAATGR